MLLSCGAEQVPLIATAAGGLALDRQYQQEGSIH
jgi:hypothetical protein